MGSGGGRAGEKEVELGEVAHLTNVRVLWSKGDLTDGLISSDDFLVVAQMFSSTSHIKL